jgi:hypothetical protein
MQKLAIFHKVKKIKEIGSAFHRAGAEIAEKGHFWMETI